MVSTRLSFSPSYQLIPIHSARRAKLSRIVVSITEASIGRAHFSSARCSTDWYQDADAREVAVPRARPAWMGAGLGDARHLREDRRRTVSHRVCTAAYTNAVAEVRR